MYPYKKEEVEVFAKTFQEAKFRLNTFTENNIYRLVGVFWYGEALLVNEKTQHALWLSLSEIRALAAEHKVVTTQNK